MRIRSSGPLGRPGSALLASPLRLQRVKPCCKSMVEKTGGTGMVIPANREERTTRSAGWFYLRKMVRISREDAKHAKVGGKEIWDR